MLNVFQNFNTIWLLMHMKFVIVCIMIINQIVFILIFVLIIDFISLTFEFPSFFDLYLYLIFIFMLYNVLKCQFLNFILNRYISYFNFVNDYIIKLYSLIPDLIFIFIESIFQFYFNIMLFSYQNLIFIQINFLYFVNTYYIYQLLKLNIFVYINIIVILKVFSDLNFIDLIK